MCLIILKKKKRRNWKAINQNGRTASTDKTIVAASLHYGDRTRGRTIGAKTRQRIQITDSGQIIPLTYMVAFDSPVDVYKRQGSRIVKQ